jgi:hypothetical protein
LDYAYFQSWGGWEPVFFEAWEKISSSKISSKANGKQSTAERAERWFKSEITEVA